MTRATLVSMAITRFLGHTGIYTNEEIPDG